MTRNRLILAVLWILSLFAISFYGGYISYGLFAFLTLIPVVSFLYLLLVLLRFKMYQNLTAPRIVSNHLVPFYFTLQNEDLFSFASVRIVFYSDFSVIDGASEQTEYALLGHTKIRQETSLLCRYRGEYEVGIRDVILRDYLNLFQITYHNREPKKAVVLPDIIELSALRDADIDSVSAYTSKSAQNENDLTVRAYIPGDDIRRIHWKQTARLGELYVRNLTGEDKNGIGLVVSNRRISTDPKVFLPVENRMLEIAIALSLLVMKKQIPVTAYYKMAEKKESSISDAASFQAFYEEMARLDFDGKSGREPLYEILAAEGGIFESKLVFIVADEVSDEAMQLLMRLSENGVGSVFYHVTDTEEMARTRLYPNALLCTIPAKRALAEVL